MIRNTVNNEYDLIKEMVKRYHSGQLELEDDDAEKLARKAYEYGLEFEPVSRPLRKGLFDLVDMGAFGMIPNEWRPTSPGQELFGESTVDKGAGAFGTTVGAFGAGALGLLGARGLTRSFQSGYGADAINAISKVKEAESLKRATTYAENLYNDGKNLLTDPFGMDRVFDFTGITWP